MGKTAIITGVTGQDGSLLAKFLLEKDYQVVGVARRTSTPTDWRFAELGIANHENFVVVSGDITDAHSLNRIVDKYYPQEFYHLAAQSFVGSSWDMAHMTQYTNVLGTINCLEAIRKHAPKCRFYFAASSEMFGGANRTEMMNENTPFYPRSPYGTSKVAGFWNTINYREAHDMFCCNGILFNHESPWRGIEFVTRKITDSIARIEMGLQNNISLGNLDACRDWGDARDFVRAMWLMLQQDKPFDYVVATGKTRSIKDFVEAALKAAGFSEPTCDKWVVTNPDFVRPADVGCLTGNSNRARMLLDWKPEISFEQMVSDMIKADRRRVANE
jgi:GDPmannose 4,6-dehydratase